MSQKLPLIVNHMHYFSRSLTTLSGIVLQHRPKNAFVDGTKKNQHCQEETKTYLSFRSLSVDHMVTKHAFHPAAIGRIAAMTPGSLDAGRRGKHEFVGFRETHAVADGTSGIVEGLHGPEQGAGFDGQRHVGGPDQLGQVTDFQIQYRLICAEGLHGILPGQNFKE